MLTRLQKRRAAAAAAAAAESAVETEKEEKKLTLKESPQVSAPESESESVIPSTSSPPDRIEEPRLSVVDGSNPPSTASDPPDLPDLVSDPEDGPDDLVSTDDESEEEPSAPPVEATINPEVGFDEESSKKNEETYYLQQNHKASKIFKQHSAVTFEFVTLEHSRDIEVEVARFKKTFKRFIAQLFAETSGFRQGVKIHLSALTTYLVVKDGEVVDSPSFYINTRARTFLAGDDDQEATIDEILGSILEQSMDIVDRLILPLFILILVIMIFCCL